MFCIKLLTFSLFSFDFFYIFFITLFFFTKRLRFFQLYPRSILLVAVAALCCLVMFRARLVHRVVAAFILVARSPRRSVETSILRALLWTDISFTVMSQQGNSIAREATLHPLLCAWPNSSPRLSTKVPVKILSQVPRIDSRHCQP